LQLRTGSSRTGGMASKPPLLLVMSPVLTQGMIRDTSLRRLRRLATPLRLEPLSRLDDPSDDALLRECEVFLTGWGCPPIDAAVLERAPRLRALFHCAGTVKPLVTDACWDRGLAVSSAADANAIPVAEYTLAAILFANKGVFAFQRRYAEERRMQLWSREYPAIGNLHKRVGIVGASRVGRRVIELLRPFDLEVRVSDPHLTQQEARALGVEREELDSLLAWADVVSLHAPLLASTRGMIDARRLSLIRDGATLVNTARGAIVEGAALERELVSGRMSAVLDTTDPEQLSADSPLYKLPNVFLTPHVAGALGAETERLVECGLGELERYVRGEPLQHGIAREDLERLA
jgi:phosphoglycerate dehydrogenase-like enzyme